MCPLGVDVEVLCFTFVPVETFMMESMYNVLIVERGIYFIDTNLAAPEFQMLFCLNMFGVGPMRRLVGDGIGLMIGSRPIGRRNLLVIAGVKKTFKGYMKINES